ncbi:MAG: hypothetical protein ACD_75C00056G0002 [uncultured bacterium]|nr:MAG: hypothetical protein ACD_75C00056G0002 [uncultured bacterium]
MVPVTAVTIRTVHIPARYRFLNSARVSASLHVHNRPMPLTGWGNQRGSPNRKSRITAADSCRI